MYRLFKQELPLNLLVDFLKNNATKKDADGEYIFDKVLFKRSEFNNTILSFLERCKPFYYSSKQEYLSGNITYRKFMTVVRQICKYHNIPIETSMHYEKSTYNIIYHIRVP